MKLPSKSTVIRTAAAVGAVVVLTGVAVLAVQHYNKYQLKETQKAQAQADQLAAEQAKAKAERAELVQHYNTLRVECEKGINAYNLLPASVRRSNPVPVCGPPVTQ